MRSVLLIDDDVHVLGFLQTTFRRGGYAVSAATTGGEGLESYAANSTDLVVLDLNLPDISGQEVLQRLRAGDPDATVIMLTGQADLETAVEAMRAGAENFLPKPVDAHHLQVAAERAYEKIELRRRARYLEERAHQDTPTETAAVGDAMREVSEKMRLVAPMDTTVLILGETGTGKSWAARAIHDLSKRAAGPFVEINCAGLTTTFLDSELFGHEKGAFTDAKTTKRGLLEVADRGTIFLDEIGDLAPELQPKLLTVIETRRFRRLGGTRDLHSDVRLLAATNRDLKRSVAEGTFREDLFYRIAVMPLVVPPLRERDPGEIIHLAHGLLVSLQRGASGPPKILSDDVLTHLVRYPWPGNIRELRNVIERAVILAGSARAIIPAHLPAEVRGGKESASIAPPARPGDPEAEITLAELESIHIRRVLERCEGNRSRAARILGISRVGLYKKLQRLDSQAPDA